MVWVLHCLHPDAVYGSQRGSAEAQSQDRRQGMGTWGTNGTHKLSHCIFVPRPSINGQGLHFLTEEKRNPKLLALQEVFFRLWRFTILMRVLKILKSMYERLFLFDRILIQHRMNETQTRPADRIATLLHESNAQIWPWNSRGTTQIPKATHDSNNLWRTWNKSEAATSTVSPHFVSTRTTCPIFADYQHYHLGLLVINPINILLIFNSIPISRYIK